METSSRGEQFSEYATTQNPEANTQVEQGEHRQPFPPYGGYPGYYPPFYPGYYPYYPYYYRRPFRRLILPLATLAALSLLPYW